jgi:hypothetical protein
MSELINSKKDSLLVGGGGDVLPQAGGPMNTDSNWILALIMLVASASFITGMILTGFAWAAHAWFGWPWWAVPAAIVGGFILAAAIFGVVMGLRHVENY